MKFEISCNFLAGDQFMITIIGTIQYNQPSSSKTFVYFSWMDFNFAFFQNFFDSSNCVKLSSFLLTLFTYNKNLKVQLSNSWSIVKIIFRFFKMMNEIFEIFEIGFLFLSGLKRGMKFDGSNSELDFSCQKCWDMCRSILFFIDCRHISNSR